ncbi:hypothetical protein M8J77_000440 [Diaphorina citri]|nr:hypothetical protein M8J77_000440 [Diaphorina citri]
MVASFFVYHLYEYDKGQAITRRWRVPDSCLLIGTMFSPIGAYYGMTLNRHKVRKQKFWTTLFFSILLHLLYAFCSICYVLYAPDWWTFSAVPVRPT